MADTNTPKRNRREVETSEYLDTVVRRTIKRAGERVADADEIELQQLIALRAVLEEAIDTAIQGQRTRSSWEKIGAALGMTRQGAYQRYGRKR